MKTIVSPKFDASKRATLSISMSCADWDVVGAALAGIEKPSCQSAADAICAGLAQVGYFVQAE